MKEIEKISKILNDCLGNLDGMEVSGTLNCGRVWGTDQNIRFALDLLCKLEEKLTEDSETSEETEDSDAYKSDEIQS